MSIQLADELALRALTEADLDEVHALVEGNREHLAGWMPWAAGQQREGTENYLRAAEQKRERGEALDFAIVLDGRIAGCAGFPIIDPYARMGIIGYWLAREHEGHGLVTRAVSALIDHGFNELGLHRIQISAATDNVRSRAIPERLGFEREGVLREAERVGDQYQDLIVYGLLDTSTRR